MLVFHSFFSDWYSIMPYFVYFLIDEHLGYLQLWDIVNEIAIKLMYEPLGSHILSLILDKYLEWMASLCGMCTCN